MKDLYQVLGLLHTAENEVIKAAYKALAQKYHPDRHPEKKFLYTEIMAELNHAHAMLGTARKRKEFDAAWKKFTESTSAPKNLRRSHPLCTKRSLLSPQINTKQCCLIWRATRLMNFKCFICMRSYLVTH